MNNSMKNTPSPWATRGWSVTGPTAAADYVAAEAVKEALPEVFVRSIGQAAEIGKAAVCTVYGLSAEEVEANALLLAAAPDLAAALRKIAKNALLASRSDAEAWAMELADIERDARATLAAAGIA